MDAVFKKLNFKGQPAVFAINAPESFSSNLASIADETTVKTDVADDNGIEFAIVFVTQQAQINQLVPQVAPLLKGDAVLWMCYPKGTSKKYKCDFNRDNGWAIMGKYDMEVVRAVAIDDDWSALRFRNVAYIKTLTRKFAALSEAGKKKAGQ